MSNGSPLVVPTNLVDLDDYSLLGVFDHLDFTELVDMADLDPRLNEIIRYHYMIPKYRINQLAIRFDDCEGTHISESSLVIYNVAHILTFLRNFGDLITDLTFHNYNNLFLIEHATEISRHIEKYCSKTLSQFSLINPNYQLISNTQTIFKRVIRLQIWQCNNLDDFQLSQKYPMVEYLYLNTKADLNSLGSLAQSYRRLQHLELISYKPLNGGSAVKDLFKLNPQIRHLALRTISDMEMIHFINDNLRQLEKLEIIYSNELNTNISSRVHFENVTDFTLFEHFTNLRRDDESPFTFDHLESLEITSTEFTRSVQNLIEQNQKIRKLSVILKLITDDLTRVVSAISSLPDLEELVIKWAVGSGIGDLLRQIEDNQSKLKKITLMVRIGSDSDSILAEVTANWELINVNIDLRHSDKYFTIVRREDNV